MKKFVYICAAIVALSMLLAVVEDAAAQTIKVKTVGRSLNSMTPAVRGAAAPPWNTSTGLRAVGVHSRTYFTVDTLGSGQVGTPNWTLVSKPSGSTTTLDSANGKWFNSIKPDLVGQYVVSATVGAQTGADTVFASTYVGVGFDAQAGCFCHPTAAAIKTSWQNSVHGTMFKRGITGYLEVERGKGAYATGCIKCHTTGWDPTINNNNFGWQAKQTGFDTSWYRGLEFWGGDYWITTGDTSRWAMLNANQRMQANVGCEQCHGPVGDHKLTGDKKMIGKSRKADVCNQCHDGSRRHSLGTYYNTSLHEQLPNGGASVGGRSNCQPCHTGNGFMYYIEHNYDTVGLAAQWNVARDAKTPISCMVCHDPHGGPTPNYLRTTRLRGDTLRNGYLLPAAYRDNPGNLCGNCHSSRYSVKVRITTTPPYYGWSDRFYPHYNMQADMLYGSNGYQYADETFTGLTTHAQLEGGCVTCHMQGRKNRLDGSANTLSNHSFSMTDTTYATGVWKPVDVCKSCHGDIEDFDDIRAFYDIDRNGLIEGVQTEIHGLLDALKARLPLDSLTGEPVTMRKDSLRVKNRPDLIRGIWNYYFVKYDRSYGAHNAKYATRLLYKALGWNPTSVKQLPGTPDAFVLKQNYPNPFNPTTTIRFSLPSEQHVKLHIFDVTGALVKTILDEPLAAGNMEVTWDGTNADWQKVASGMYLYRIQAGTYSSIKKMIMMK
jgi:hypothetical protein